MMRRLFTTFVVFVVALVGTATASEWPNEGQLKAQFLLQLPGYWTLSGFTVEATANYGTEVEPIIKSRFNAVVELRTDTFALQEEEGVITWLTPVTHAGETRTVYGLSTATRAAGAWQIDFALENNPMPRLGQPRDFFSGRTIVRGGDEEAAYLEELARPRLVEEEMRHKDEVARRQREMELEELDHQTELARLRQQEEMDAAEQEAAARTAEAERQAAEAALADLAERARTQLAFDLPGYWRLADFKMREAKSENGDLFQAFTATIELAGATFVESERDGPVVVVTPVAAAGERRELLGAVRWTRAGEAWNGTFTFENNPMEGLGRPLDFFEGRVLIAGSEQDAAWRAERHAAEIARLEHEEERRAKEREAELAALTHREGLDEAEHARAAAEAAAKTAEMEELVGGIGEELRARVAIGLPGHWRLEGFEIQEHAWRGESQSELELSFAAEAELAVDTFNEVLEIEEHARRGEGQTEPEPSFAAEAELPVGPFNQADPDGQVLFVTPVASAGERRTIYGAGIARRAGESWQYEIETHNDPVAGLGLPIDYFEGRVLVQGSEEAKAYLEQQHQEELARRKREEELREQERPAALAQQRHEQVLEEERQKVGLARVAFDEKLAEERETRQERETQRARERAERELAAVIEALGSSDRAVQATAFETALASDDPRLRNQALTYFLSQTKGLSVQLNARTEDERRFLQNSVGTFSLDVARFDPPSGQIAGQVVTDYRHEGQRTFTGRLSGDTLSLASSACQLEARLAQDRSMRGKVRCARGGTRSGEWTLS